MQALLSHEPKSVWTSLLNSLLNAKSKEEVVNLLRYLSKRESLFSSPHHYEYFKRYVLPKLALVLRDKYEVRQRWRTYEHLFFMDVVVSETYVVVHEEEQVYVISYYWDEPRRDRSSVNYHVYILGLGSDGKVFVNRVETLQYDDLVLVREFGNVRVLVARDEAIESTFQYDGSADGLSEITVNSDGAYRVQGEVILRCEKADYCDRVIGNMFGEVRRLVNTLLADKVFRALLELGFSPVLTEDGSYRAVVTIPRCHNNRFSFMNRAIRVLSREIAKALEREGMVLKEVEEKAEYERRMSQRYLSDEYGEFLIEYVFDYPRLARYGDVEIAVRPTWESREEAPKIVRVIEEDLASQLRTLERSDFKTAVGRHLVTVKRALSLNVRYAPRDELQPTYLGHIALQSGERGFYVDNESEIIIDHEEHGRIKIRFSQGFAVFLETTRVHRDFNDEMNRVALSLLVER